MEIPDTKRPDSDLVDVLRRIPPTPVLTNSSVGLQALMFPFIETPEVFGDVLNRLIFALTPALPESFSLLIPTNAGFDPVEIWARLPVPDYEFEALRQNPPGRFCQAVAQGALQGALEAADLVLLWNAGGLRDPEIQANLDRVLILDPGFYLDVEAVNHARLRQLVASQAERKILGERSGEAFADLFRKFRGIDDACLFLTGPSLETGLRRPLSEGSLRIICNSLVKNETYLDEIQPDILVFADPAFHYGVSRYAAAFREQAMKALTRYPDCICIVPENYLPGSSTVNRGHVVHLAINIFSA